MLLSFFPGNNLAAVVVSAIGTDMVRQPGVVALGTIGKIRGVDFPVRAAFAATSFGMSSFWIWHNVL
jgi:hypothetical protein